MQGTKISRYQVRDDKKGIPVYPRELVKAPEKEVLTGEYKSVPEIELLSTPPDVEFRNNFISRYGPGKISSSLFGPYPNPKTIALGQNPLTIQGFELAKIRPGLGWKDEFGLFVYPIPAPL